jgi:hypothetical protein
MAGDGGRHQPDRAGTDDQHVLAEHRKAQRWTALPNGSKIAATRRSGPVVPDVRDRKHDLLGKGVRRG